MLSGSQASLSVSQAENYVSGQTTTPSVTAGIAPTTTITTGTVTTGLNVNITSAWDQSTVYGAINITLNDLVGLNLFGTGASSVQLPQTTSRSIATEIRVRPGDSILIGGLVSQSDNTTTSGPGFTVPLFATERSASKVNTELVFLLRPRVVVFAMGDDGDTPRVVDAPKDGMFPPEQNVRKLSESVNNAAAGGTASLPVDKNAVKNTVDNKAAALPAGLSPEAFAPQNTPAPAAPEDIPASLQDQALPVSLSGKPAADGGGKKPSDGNDGEASQSDAWQENFRLCLHGSDAGAGVCRNARRCAVPV